MKPIGRCLIVSFLALGPQVSAVEIDWTFVGNPGNACVSDLAGGCNGAVAHHYVIGTFEVTNAEYAAFLNAKADYDPFGLYNPDMAGNGASQRWGGITRSGAPGTYSYSTIPGREDMPVHYVSFYDALRFVNWLNNADESGETEIGAYTLLGGTPVPSNGTTVTRNPGAKVFLPSEDEWFKAAYYDGASASYFTYPARSSSPIDCEAPSAGANKANCRPANAPPSYLGDMTARGSYPGSASPYGTFDQGGNVFEWNESIFDFEGAPQRGRRGGSFTTQDLILARWHGWASDPTYEALGTGFRVAPEPVRVALLGAGLALLVAVDRLRHRR
jgi:formylglycine-generating enzyme required for sulfatase activity